MTSRSDATIKDINYQFNLFDCFISKFFITKTFFHTPNSLISVFIPCIACNHCLAPFLPIENILTAQSFAHLCLTAPYLHFWEIVRHLL